MRAQQTTPISELIETCTARGRIPTNDNGIDRLVWTSGHVGGIGGLCRGESSVRVPCACRSWHVKLLHERQRMAVCCVTAAGISVSVVTAKLKSRLPGAASLPNFICLHLLDAVPQRERIVFSAPGGMDVQMVTW